MWAFGDFQVMKAAKDQIFAWSEPCKGEQSTAWGEAQRNPRKKRFPKIFSHEGATEENDLKIELDSPRGEVREAGAGTAQQ